MSIRGRPRKVGKTYPNMAELLASPVRILQPPERLTVSQAAEKYRKVNNPGSYVGPWRNSTTPYLTEIMDTLGSREYNACILAAPAQTGKTDAILNWHAHGVICEPADFLLVQTSQSVARDFSKRRVDRLHRHSPAVGNRLLKRKDSDNTHDKSYDNGTILTLSWPAINELSGRPVGHVALTDYDRMPQNVDGEGSPFDLARKRTTTFGTFAMTFCESSPGFSVHQGNWVPRSKHEAPPAPGVLALYNRGDRRLWYWPCWKCGAYYEPSFSMLSWPNSRDVMECAEQATMLCPKCFTPMTPDMRSDINVRGQWAADGQHFDEAGKLCGKRPRSDIASFWLKGPAAAFATWSTLVANYLKAEEEFERTGSQEALRSTVNTDQGEPYFERGFGKTRAPEDLSARSEDFDEEDQPVVPEGVVTLIATIDVQANRWEVQVQGLVPPVHGAELPDHVVIDRFAIIKSNRKDDDGDPYWVKPASYLEDWDLLTEQVLQKSYPLIDGSGRRMGIKLAGCDSGGKKGVTSMAYEYFRKLKREGLAGRFLLLKGEPNPKAPKINLTYPDSQRKDRFAAARGEIPVLLVQSDKVKDQLDNALDRTEAGGMIRFARSLPDEFYTELTVETKDEKGRWQNPRKLRNEAWDLLAYYFGLCSYSRIEHIDWSKPPEWASSWDTNSLVSETTESRRFNPQKAEQKLEDLAAALG